MLKFSRLDKSLDHLTSVCPTYLPPRHFPPVFLPDQAVASPASPATTTWKAAASPSPFGPTHHTMTPTQWALQFLSLNICHGLADYLEASILDVQLATARSSPSLPPPRSLRGNPHSPFPVPSRARLRGPNDTFDKTRSF
jgi:hypothetical protein